MALSPDGNQLAIIVDDASQPRVKFLDITNGRELRTINLPDEDFATAQIALTPDGRALVCGIVDKQLKLWDLTAKASVRDLGRTANDYSPVKFSRDGRQVALVEGYTVRRWDTTTGQELAALKLPSSGLLSAPVSAFVSFSDDGKRVATGGFDTPTILWDLRPRVSNFSNEWPHQHGIQGRTSTPTARN